MKLWQHEDTGRVVVSNVCPSNRWFRRATMQEDELPDDLFSEMLDKPVEYGIYSTGTSYDKLEEHCKQIRKKGERKNETKRSS